MRDAVGEQFIYVIAVGFFFPRYRRLCQFDRGGEGVRVFSRQSGWRVILEERVRVRCSEVSVRDSEHRARCILGAKRRGRTKRG